MTKRISWIALAVLALVTLTYVAATAQIAPIPQPDAYVRGNGAINVPGPIVGPNTRPNLGIFNINVWRENGALFGGFNYTEVAPNGARVVAIVSKELLALNIHGNTAKIIAKGAYSDRTGTKLACLTLDVVDNKPDKLHIRADGYAATVLFYDKGGDVVKGDIVVWQKPWGFGYASGYGEIKVPSPDSTRPNIGCFRFKGECSSAGVMGMITYSEIVPTITTAISKPVVRIDVPKLSRMVVSGNKAVLEGPGMMNGKPVFVTVVGVDNEGLRCDGGRCLDWFSIKAVAPNTDAVKPAYYAEGPLARGDIKVGTYSEPPPPPP